MAESSRSAAVARTERGYWDVSYAGRNSANGSSTVRLR
jgi:hypothetical protein